MTQYCRELWTIRYGRQNATETLTTTTQRLAKPFAAGSCDQGSDNDWQGHPRMFCDANSQDWETFDEFLANGVRVGLIAFPSRAIAMEWWSASLPEYDHSDPGAGQLNYRRSLAFCSLSAKEKVLASGSIATGEFHIRFDRFVLKVGEIYRDTPEALLDALWNQASALLKAALTVLTEKPFEMDVTADIIGRVISTLMVEMYMGGAPPPTITCSLSNGTLTASLSMELDKFNETPDGRFFARYFLPGPQRPWYPFEPPPEQSQVYTLITEAISPGLSATSVIDLLYPTPRVGGSQQMVSVTDSQPLKPYPPANWALEPVDPLYWPERIVYAMHGTGNGQVAVSVIEEAVTDFDGSVSLAVLSDPLFIGGADSVQDHGVTELNAVTGEITPSNGSRAQTQGTLDDAEYYGFFVSPLGAYRIVHHAGGVSTPIVEWTQSDALSPGYGAWNQLRMVRAGGALKFYGNGVLLHTIESPAFSQGIFGLYATDSDDPQNPARVLFDHIAFLGTLVEPRVELEVQKSGAGAGTVTSSPAGISCGADCQRYYKKNTTVTLSAAAGAGSTFAGWSGACSGMAGCTVTMDVNKSVTAQFLPTGAIVEDFNDGLAQGWVDDGSGYWSVTGGAYVMAGNRGNAKRFTLYDGTFCDVRFQADIRKTAGDQAGTNYTYGLHVRGDEGDSSYYSIVIATDGRYMIGKRVDGAFTTLVDWTLSHALRPGKNQWNTLAVEAEGTLLKFFANSTLLANIVDDSLACGKVGLYAYDAASSDVPDRVEFDNVLIMALDSGETYALTVDKTGDGTVTAIPPGVNCGTSCSASYPKGTSVTLTATPASGYDFAYYTGGCSSANPVCSLILTTDRKVAARFVSKKSKKLNLVVAKTKTNKGDGTVTSTDGRVTCGTDCRESYYLGSPVRLTATALPNSVFVSWSGCPSPSGDICALTVEKSVTVKEVFIGPYPLKVQRVLKNKAGGAVASSDGKISCGTDCQESYIYNTSVTLTANPDTGSTFTGWTGCETFSGNTCTVAMKKAKTVRATFDKPKGR